VTRFLSDSLGAGEPSFRKSLLDMEPGGHGHNTDIRFSNHMRQAARAKVQEMGLDPDNTTPEELYHLLQQRLEADEARLTRHLQTEAATHVSAEADVVSGMVHVLRKQPGTQSVFALKNGSLRAIIRQLPPKKAMKQLGYRSLDSFLKHETPVSILAAAWLSEGITWQHRLLDQYKRLQPGDFESRALVITRPDSPKWRALAENVVRQKRHTILSFKELGALVFLPLPKDRPDGVVTATLGMALHELNQIRAASTFLKLCQVRPDFGSLVKAAARDEPEFKATLLGQPLSWQLIQRYYSRLTEQFREELFEPHIRLEDMVWHPIEKTLSAIEPGLKFWEDTAHLGIVHDRKPVSLNIIDVALNRCNRLPFERRVAHYMRQSLWHELLLQYLPHAEVERTVMSALQPKMKLAAEAVPA
jgi:hypothetical protein